MLVLVLVERSIVRAGGWLMLVRCCCFWGWSSWPLLMVVPLTLLALLLVDITTSGGAVLLLLLLLECPFRMGSSLPYPLWLLALLMVRFREPPLMTGTMVAVPVG